MSHVSLKRLAAEIGMDRSSARRYILRLGILPVKRRTGDSGFQVALTVTAAQLAEVKRARAADGYLTVEESPSGKPDISTFSDQELMVELERRLAAGTKSIKWTA